MRPKLTEERLAEPKPILSEISKIDKSGIVIINFHPAEVWVPKEWRQIFIPEEREKLNEKVQLAYQEFSRQFLSASFFKESDELDQDVFTYELVEFSPGGLQIQLYFSEPLLVS